MFLFSLLHAPRSSLPAFVTYACCRRRVNGSSNWYNPRVPTMVPVLSHELLLTAVEMVCYFCTAVGVACTFFFATRA